MPPVVIKFDGGCFGNGRADAKAYCAWIVCKGKVELGRSGGVIRVAGRPTNNVAEWEGLLQALRWAGANDLLRCKVVIYGDSRLVVEQVSGRWRAKCPRMAGYAACCRKLLSGADWKAKWVPRSENAEVDRLAKRLFYRGQKCPESGVSPRARSKLIIGNRM